MEKVKLVFHPMLDEFGDIKTKEKVIECYGWTYNENYYTFFLTQNVGKVLNIPKENVFYVEDII